MDLHDAVRSGDLKAVEALLASGADVNARDNDKATPLHLAARNGDPAVLNVLLSPGADVDAVDEYGCGDTPLHLAARSGHLEVVKAP